MLRESSARRIKAGVSWPVRRRWRTRREASPRSAAEDRASVGFSRAPADRGPGGSGGGALRLPARRADEARVALGREPAAAGDESRQARRQGGGDRLPDRERQV